MSIHRFYNDIEEWEYGSVASIYFLYQGMQKYNVAYKGEIIDATELYQLIHGGSPLVFASE